MAVAVPLAQERTLDKEEYKFPDGYIQQLKDNATSNDISFTFSATKNTMESVSYINNNIVWEKLQSQDSTSEGSRLSSPVPEISCCTEFSDAKFPTVLTATLPQQAAAKQDSELEKPIDPYIIDTKNEDADTVPIKSVCDETVSSTIDKERERENTSANIKDVNRGMAKVQDIKKERIRNIGRSIEWIKCELTAMRDERFLLTKQFEHIFEEIMDFKLRIEMARDEDEQIHFEIEEEVYEETQL